MFFKKVCALGKFEKLVSGPDDSITYYLNIHLCNETKAVDGNKIPN